MPATFWRDEAKLDIFKTKPCQRLCDDGLCKWKSRCQYSHCIDWPRRQLRKYKYSPEICPHLRFYTDENGATQVVNQCMEGPKCQKGHSKEEILYHPLIFKTTPCEEYASNAAMKTPSAKRKRCHRFYCPFAHGNNELRSSSLPEATRNYCLMMASQFPSDSCCSVCTPYSFIRPARRGSEDSRTDRVVRETKTTPPTTTTFVIPPPPFPCPPPPSMPFRLLETVSTRSGSPMALGDSSASESSKHVQGIQEQPPRRNQTYDLWSDSPMFVNLVGGSIVSIGPRETTSRVATEREPLPPRPYYSI